MGTAVAVGTPPYGLFNPTIFPRGGDPQMAFDASIPDTTAACTQPVLKPLLVQSPAG